MVMLNSLWIDNPLIGTFHDLLHIPWQHVLAAIFIGLAQFTGMSLSVMAYQKGNGARISWLEYIAIPISFGYQIWVFHEEPNEFEISGATMVVIGSLLPGIHQMVSYIKERKTSMFPIEEEYEEIS